MIETGRLILRDWRARDRAAFAAMNADPEVMDDDFPGPMSRAESDRELAHFRAAFARDGFSFAAAERKSDGVLIGMVGIARADFDAPICPCVEIGWRLARRFWGQGYATEAARAWLGYGFDTLGLDEIVAFTDAGLERSQAVMRRLGMFRDPARDFDHPDLPAGHPLRRQALFAMPRAVWRG